MSPSIPEYTQTSIIEHGGVRRMKIGLTVYGSLETRSGGFRYDRQLVEQLRDKGDTVKVVELPWRTYPRGLVDNVSIGIRRRLAVDVDVMLQDELAHPSLISHNRRCEYPIVTIVHHLRASERRLLSPLYRRIEAQYLSTVDAVINNSVTTEQTVTKLIGEDVPSIVAPPAGDRFDPLIDSTTIRQRAQTDPLQVVFVGNLIPRKGVDTLIDAVAKVDADLRVVIVGSHADGKYVRSLKRSIRNAGLDNIELTGAVADDTLQSILKKSHVLAVPSRYEGLGIVYLEGMSFGLPAIATTAGGATELVTDGKNGRLVSPDDPAGLANTLEQLATDREKLVELSLGARQRYDQHPDWEATANKVRELICKVVDGDSATVSSSLTKQ